MSAGLLAMPRRSAPLPVATEPVVSNTRLAIVIVIVAETMLFAGLIGMYLVFRLGAPAWPPPNLPRLPIAITTLNTLILLASTIPLARALRAARRHDGAGRGGVQIAAVLGLAFLVVQGLEWLRLLAHGLTPGGSVYGGAFYLLIGCHAVHALVGVCWLAVMAVRERRARPGWSSWSGLEMGTIYWFFVCGLWLVLFPLVYLY